MAASPAWLIYQPLIVGLGAVVLATLGNTLLEWYRQKLHDRREARILRCAFLQELRTQRRMIANSISDEQRAETEGAFVVPVDDFMPVYESMIAKIGLLEPREVSAILEAYSYLVLAPKNLALIGHLRKSDFATFMVVGAEYVDTLMSLNEKLLAAIDPAIAILSEGREQP